MNTILAQVAIGLVISFLLSFIMLNMIVGCQDWANPACVTPVEFFEIMRSPFQ